jgi:hypothetical protein
MDDFNFGLGRLDLAQLKMSSQTPYYSWRGFCPANKPFFYGSMGILALKSTFCVFDSWDLATTLVASLDPLYRLLAYRPSESS